MAATGRVADACIAVSVMTTWEAPELIAQKKAFARALLSCSTSFEAASQIFPGSDNVGRCFQVKETWVSDPIVIAEMERLIADRGKLEFLPDKAALAKAVWVLATEGSRSTKDKIDAFALYGEVMGFIEKPMPGSKDASTPPPDINLRMHPDDEKPKTDA